MACSTTTTVQVCYTEVRNILTGAVVTTTTCEPCVGPAVSFDSSTNELTIRTTLTYYLGVTVNDNLTASCSVVNITTP